MQRHLLAPAFALLVLSACGPAATPNPTATPELISECFPYYDALVWSDLNGNGAREADEPPLMGVAVTMYPLGNSSRSFPTQTNAEGMATVNGIGDFGRHCDELEIVVSPPSGYTASTPERLNLAGLPVGSELQFGLIPPALTPTPASQTVWPDLRQIPALYPPMDPLPIDGCPFASNELLESLVGPLAQPPFTMVIILPPHYEQRASIRCSAHSGNNVAYVDVWFAPDANSARADYDETASLVGDEAIPVNGLGEAALWWPRGLRLEAARDDARLTVSLAAPLADSANGAAALAASAAQVIDSTAGQVRAEPISVPAESPAPEVVYLRDVTFEGGVFEACNLLTPEDIESALGKLEFPLLSGSSIGELGPQVYECMTDQHEPAAWMYYGLVFGETPGDAILNYWRETANRPGNAAPVEDIGDEAWFWVSQDGASLNLSALRGNVTLSANMLIEDTPENRARFEALIRLVLDRLFERG